MSHKKKWAKLECSTCECVYVLDAEEVPTVVKVGEYLYGEMACPSCGGDSETAALRVLTLDAEEAAK